MLGGTTVEGNEGTQRRPSGLDDLWLVDNQARGRWRETDAQIVQVGVAVVLLLLLTALVGAVSIAPAKALGQRAARDAKQVSAAARDMYLGLADADTSANAYFTMSTGSSARSAAVDRYCTATAGVDGALATAVAYINGDSHRLADVQLVATRLQNYRAAIGHANRLAVGRDLDSGEQCAEMKIGKLPPGNVAPANIVFAAAFARVGSDYLRDALLGAVERLWTNETARLHQARSRGLEWLVISVVLAVLDLVALLALQRWLRRRTRRRLNIGLVVSTAATAVVLVLTCWSWSHFPAANGQLKRVEEAVQAEIETQQQIGRLLKARAEEYLEVGINPDPDKHEENFRAAARCGQEDQIDKDVCKIHSDLLEALDDGDNGARQKAIMKVLPGGDSTAKYDELMSRFKDEIDYQATTTESAVKAMPSAPPMVGWWAAGLMLAGSFGAAGGLRPRFNEYR